MDSDTMTLNIYLSEDGKVMDLTGNQIGSLSQIFLPPSLTELDLTTNRLSDIESVVSRLQHLEKLSFRQNLLTDAACLKYASSGPKPTLLELILRDNQLSQVPPLSSFPLLQHLDLSYNSLSSMAGLSQAPPTLIQLYLANNSIPLIQEISHLSHLKLLELGSNKIRDMSGLEMLTQLEELWLGRNKIRHLNLHGLCMLKKVSVQSNRLTSMKGFEECHQLEELYLSHNGISVMEGMEALTKLKVLDLAGNIISHVQGLSSLTLLEDLWLNDNRIESLEELEKELEGPKFTLTTLYIGRNPCANDKGYAPRLKKILKNVQQIDSFMYDVK